MRAKPAVVASILCLLASAPTAAQAPKLVKTFADWSSYAHDDGKAKICFVASRPKSQEPKNVTRGPAFFYISAWPKDGVKTEISIKIGYLFKKDSDVTVTVGNASFKLFTQNDRAYVGDPTQELKLIDAMKKGSSLQVQGTSERGTGTTDNYSLSGLAQAIQSLTELCQ
jgi:invasion protein IalB